MKLILAFLLVPAGAAAYFALALMAGWGQRIPWIAFACMAISIAWLLSLTVAKPTFFSISTTIASIAATGLFAWWTMVYSKYQPVLESDGIAKVSAPAFVEGMADAALSNSDGASVPIRSVLRPATNQKAKLLVFYRGYW